MRRALLAFLLFAAACGNTPSTTPPPPVDDASADVLVDAAAPDVTADTGPNLGPCATSFGAALTSKTFGYVDGTLHAIVRPQDQQCTKPNGTHVNLQVRMNGSVYRMLVNVQSDHNGVDPNVGFAEKTLGPLTLPFSEGWHTGVAYDYVTDLGLHDTDFTAIPLATLTDTIVARVQVGDPIRVYATGFGEGGHLIHRNGNGVDGVVIVGPTTNAPKALAFRFADQTF